ncbi:DUF547 domain-containing protein [Alteromonas sp. C1M14]|uniref:DUF547 domain-containing protein n=1 Tax=Alteromonas sp. C1M14 TaxID=2841567 RepID=UPI001C08217F|nr:DUF547 domain-containing protein [Alteromonas sp. C1M14]MBU2979780.1 DUF547 domain-containing protein [Alteromonas sp. C1M14]
MLSFFVMPSHGATQSLAPAQLHESWDTLLKQYVHPINNGHSTEVDYAGFANDRQTLTKYLEQLAAVPEAQFKQWPKHSQLAFLINAYNAYTIELILSRYPDLSSIRELGSFLSSPWKQDIGPLLGEERTLDGIEHGLIRGDNKYNEPRIHFAVNCASVGCPALREEAYTGDKLEMQLADQTQRFLSDRSRNHAEGKTLTLSKIFDWYGDDFEMNGNKGLADFLAQYHQALGLTPTQQDALIGNDIDIRFSDYDWSLNDVSKP